MLSRPPHRQSAFHKGTLLHAHMLHSTVNPAVFSSTSLRRVTWKRAAAAGSRSMAHTGTRRRSQDRGNGVAVQLYTCTVKF